jgi:hypothetical protein
MRTTRSHLRRLAATAAVVLLAVGSAARAQAAGETPLAPTYDLGGPGPRIVNGTLTSAYPSVGALLSPGSATTGGLVCSGTLIGCETFLTAAHCVCDTIGSECQTGGVHQPNPSQYVVFFQHAGFFAVSSISVRSDFNFPVGDIAVIKLASPVSGIAPTPVDVTGAPAFGASARIVGFGRNAGASDYGLKRAGAVTMASCVAGISNTTSVCWDFTSPIGVPGTDSDTCNGDSGGPLFADFQCGDTVAGITSGGTSASCQPTDHSYDANVFHYSAYIASVGGADLANASCGAMPQAGEAGAPIFAASGTISSGAPQALHTVDVPAGTTRLRIAMNASEDLASDFDLYVKAGSPPTTSDFDCKADGPNQFGFCEFTSPAPGTWYVLVQRFQGSGQYQVTATTYASGAPGPGTNGQTCDDGNSCTSGDVCQGGACGGTAVANGTGCDDGSACTAPDVCQAGVCTSTAAPVAGCRPPVVSGRASLTMKNAALDTRDNLTWKWLKGDATTSADFGDPTASDGYELCLFDESAGVPSLVLDKTIAPGAGWTPTTRGYKYYDPNAAQGGFRTVLLKNGEAGSAGITVKAKGVALAPPALPLAQSPEVIVQLVGANACFEARYGTNRTNDGLQFRAKAD